MSFFFAMGGLIAAFILLDRVAVWAESRGWIHWRRPGGGNGAAGLFNAAQSLIAPSNAHVVEEQQRMQLYRHTSVAEGSPFELDTENGSIRLTRRNEELISGRSAAEVGTPDERRPGSGAPTAET